MACQDELNSLQEKKVYEQVPRPKNAKILATKWVFAVKVNPDNKQIERFKARIVVRGFEQIMGMDYEDIFAPVVSHTTIRTFLTFAAITNMQVHQLDVKTAFLNGELTEDIFVDPPPGMTETGVWKLNKGLYGLRQAARCWFEKFTDTLKTLHFQQGQVDSCVFWKDTNQGRLFVIIYVDDVLAGAQHQHTIDEFKTDLKSMIEIRDMGKVKNFLEMQIQRGKGWFSINQEKQIADQAQRFQATKSKRIRRVPQVETIDFGEDYLDQEGTREYRSLIGALLYVANQTRIDTAFPVNFLSRFMQKPTQLHWKYAMKILSYLYHTRNRRLYLGKKNEIEMEAYSDASFGNLEDYRSQSGTLVTLYESPVSWLSRKQDNVSQSSTEAEYVALLASSNEAGWIRDMLNEWGWKITGPTKIYEDNQQVIRLISNGQVNTRAKYLNIKLKVLNELILKGKISVHYVPSKDNWADILTKTKNSGEDSFGFNGNDILGFRNQGE